MNFTKIHHIPDKDVALEWFEVNDKGTHLKTTLESRESPFAGLQLVSRPMYERHCAASWTYLAQLCKICTNRPRALEPRTAWLSESRLQV